MNKSFAFSVTIGPLLLQVWSIINTTQYETKLYEQGSHGETKTIHPDIDCVVELIKKLSHIVETDPVFIIRYRTDCLTPDYFKQPYSHHNAEPTINKVVVI